MSRLETAARNQSTEGALEAIRAKAAGAIEVALHAHDVDYHVGAGAKRLASQVTAEYHDRFLIELIQNAHDAHPKKESSGAIKILFDPAEGDFGVLYVANGGNPFSRSNFRTICELGLSDKPPGEGIGNKGIGFKSVLQICERPEIYSASSPGSSSFDGYCFSFATDAELLDLLQGDRTKLEIVRAETGRFQIPVALDDAPNRVRSYEDGQVATVVRLPLDRAGAADEVDEQLRLLVDGESPILLFLDRLQSLTIERPGPSESVTLRRRKLESNLKSRRGHFEVVDLGTQGRFFCSTVDIPRDKVREAVSESVKQRQIDEAWLEWQEPARVSVAVRLDEEGKGGRLYTYLPMEIQSPFNGHLNAPFYAKLDRRDVSADVTLNHLFLDAAAQACTLGALAISEGEADLREAAVDLFGWDADQADRLTRVSDEIGVNVLEATVIPTTSSGGETWGSLTSAYRSLEAPTKVLDHKAFAEAAGIDFISLQLSSDRTDRVERLHRALLSRGMEPTTDELAEWTEKVAESARSRRSLRWWNQFYEDVAILFEDDSSPLAGRRILLDEKGELQATISEGSDEVQGPTVFFQPMRERAEGVVDIEATDDVSIPASLERQMVFLHRDLQWLERTGNQRRQKKSRRFLEDEGLVRPYAARTLLEHIGAILKKSKSKQVSSDALRLAFRLQRTREYDQRPSLRGLGLRVPSQKGWIDAQKAVFSEGWPRTLGESVESLIKLAASTSPRLQSLKGVLLLPPGEWPFRIDVDEWRDFLAKAGVRDGLIPDSVSGSVRQSGWYLSAETLSKHIELNEQDGSYWPEAVKDEGATPSYQTSMYVNKNPIYVLPGQQDWASFSARAKEEFAYLIAASCGRWGDDTLTLRFERADVVQRNFDALDWPSPVSAFLKNVEWLPVGNQARGNFKFERPGGAWHFSETLRDESDYSRPEWADLLPTRFRRVLDAQPESLDRLVSAGLSVWNTKDHAPRLVRHLGDLVAEGSVKEPYWPSLSKAYQQAWKYLCDLDDVDLDAEKFVVLRSGQIGILNLDDEGSETLCVPDGGSEMVDNVLHLSSLPVLEVDPRIGEQAHGLLSVRFPDKVALTSSLEVLVLTGGVPFSLAPDAENLLTVDRNWLEFLFVACIELKHSVFRTVTATVRQRTLETLRSLRIVPVDDVSLQVGTDRFPPPHSMRSAVPVADPTSPSVLIVGMTGELSWRQLDGALPAISDLLGFPELVPSLRLAVRHFATGDVDERVSPQGTSEIAAALDVPEQRVIGTLRELRGAAAALMDVLAPAIVVFLGIETYDNLSERAEDLVSEQDIAESLRDQDIPVGVEELLRLGRAAQTADELRLALGIDLTAFNEALRLLGRPPIHYLEEHAQVFATYVAENKERFSQHLRGMFLDVYRAQEPLEPYVEYRDGLNRLSPRPEWLDLYEEPPVAVMEEAVMQWLAAARSEQPVNQSSLRPLEEVQRENRQVLRQVTADARRVVLAWTEKQSRSMPEGWARSELEHDLWNGLLSGGVVDFEILTQEFFLAYLEAEELWPSGMPLTLSIETLDLTVSDLDTARTEEERRQAQRDFEKRSIEIDGQRHAATPENFGKLAELVRASLSDSFLKTRPGFADLVVPAAPIQRGRAPRSKTGSVALRSMTEAQRGAIGLIGEVVALEWLKRNYSGATDDSWKSTYRDFVLGGSLGNDSLGYDFEVPYGRASLFFEVKATSGESPEIELGESEVLKARELRRSNRYRILWLPNVLDAERRRPLVLPNPFSDRGQDSYRLVGSGLRYRFVLDS